MSNDPEPLAAGSKLVIAGIAAVGATIITLFVLPNFMGPAAPATFFCWCVGLVALSVFCLALCFLHFAGGP